ncbi:MAG: NACHT domain-containing protein [Hyphomonas sp.]|nr:NACHT domain-containing protein [Hyphomonas sp.]
MQLVFPDDDLYAIAVEGLSTSETAKPGTDADDVADLTLFFGQGDNFATCERQEVLQFKYKVDSQDVTASYLKKTIKKFAASLVGYEKEFSVQQVNEKLSFAFVTNTDFSAHLWEAIRCLKEGSKPSQNSALGQYNNLKKWCQEEGADAQRLFSLIEYHASTQSLNTQNSKLRRTLSSWSPGADGQARARLHGLEALISERAGVSGQRNNLVKREDVLDVLGCDSEDDLFPAETGFVDVGVVVERQALDDARQRIGQAEKPFFIFADGGVGKTVFVQSLAQQMGEDYETVVFDCFGGGSYRSEDQSRHLPKVGLLQIVNELASRGLCDPQLPTDGDSDALIRAARKRLEQAAQTVRARTIKQGILVIIDAADNAQLEADDRKEKAFPRLLLANLSREPLDGVRLVLTARPHRMDDVIGKSDVERFELGAFTEDETRAFLESRRDSISGLEFSTVLARSGGNARVLEYLVQSWDENIAGTVPHEIITVEELIRQRCEKIFRDLHQAGWSDDEVKQFFTAISLLPPPIPLNEMASALGWPQSKVNSAVSDLAPMLEVLKHGAIFRDEPTETFIRENYASESSAQQEIADRLNACQSSSVYAAEALPRFLVVIEDSDRAYALSNSEDFPGIVKSEYGRRRLRLLRLGAAFCLTVKERDYDRTLRLTLQLAQVASADAKGDRFIRNSPGIAVSLGDQDTSRRLFQDRSGWRGARDARLIVAYAFQGELGEAEIHQNRAIGWINWDYRNRNDEDRFDRSQPSVSDFAAVVFLSIVQGHHTSADRNIAKWNYPFAIAVCRAVIALLEQYEVLTGEAVLADLAVFASSKDCTSFALQVSLMASNKCLDFAFHKRIARSASPMARAIGKGAIEDRHDDKQALQRVMNEAALSALLHNSRQSAVGISRVLKAQRVSRYDYSERYGSFRGWAPILSACVSAWATGAELQFHHLLPHEVKSKRAFKSIRDKSALIRYLEGLEQFEQNREVESKRKREKTKQFSSQECRDIAGGIDLVIELARTLQDVVLKHRRIGEQEFRDFLQSWESRLRFDIHWNAETAQDSLARNVGFGFALLFLRHGRDLTEDDASKLTQILGRGRFTIEQKLSVLLLLARHSNLHGLAGQFARQISEDVRHDEYIEQRGEHYISLTEALLPLGTAEAQHYFREGLAQLDQLGGDDYDTIYSVLYYAAEQKGGWLKPALGHRLMNLCQTIIHHEPSKFGWTLFSRAAAQSIGIQAIYKMVRWSDQDTAKFSYGLPQLACFLAKKGHLDPRRAAFILLLCKNEGWHEWKIGDGLNDLLGASSEEIRQLIWRAVFGKLKFEYPFGGARYLWKNLLDSLDGFQSASDNTDVEDLRILIDKSSTRSDEENRRRNPHVDASHFAESKDRESEQREIDEAFEQIVRACDLSSPHSIDEAIRIVRADRRFMFNAEKRVVDRLRGNCPYEQRTHFITVIGELVELDFDDAVESLIETISLWEDSSAHIASNKTGFIQQLFEMKGSELFDLRYTGILREIHRIAEFCGDAEFVLNLVLDTIVREKIELTGDEWLQLATGLCQHASGEANLDALENLLSGPAVQIGDEIGEGVFRESFTPPTDQSTTVAEITWHLLGNEDAFIRWTTARSIKGLADLGLHSDVAALLDYYDRPKVDALASKDIDVSFFNAQQWLLMGLARACLHHGEALSYIRGRLEQLYGRQDTHALNKLHIGRCLQHIAVSPAKSELWNEVCIPAKGYADPPTRPKPTESTSGFEFDHEFHEREISGFARLFGMSHGEAIDAVADEIKARWPEAEDMNFFSGNVRYRRSRTDRYESYRESVQKHALLLAATKLAGNRPVIREKYEAAEARPWAEWLERYDVSFESGAWLSDRKDEVPTQAAEWLLARNAGKDALEDQESLLRKVGLLGDTGEHVPLCGHWRSVDGVVVRMISALAQRKGVIGRCKAFSNRPDHDLWLPSFDSYGNVDRHMIKSDFEPLIWEPERYPEGIDVGDEFATSYPVSRPRLGRALIRDLSLRTENEGGTWLAEDRSMALRSQVWGQWQPDPDNPHGWHQDEGVLLWACPDWLNTALSKLNRRLVFYINFYRPKPYRSFDDRSRLRAAYVALRMPEGTYRVWQAKEAMNTAYH